jgi:uncharacterized protein DUF3168
MITVAAVFAGVRLLWVGSQGLSELVPGGLWEGFAKQAAAWPYAVARITEGDPTHTSGDSLWPFTLEISVWSKDGRHDTGEIEAAMTAAFRQGRVAHMAVAGARCVHMLPTGGETKDDGRHDAQDVKLTAKRWQLLFKAPQ